MRVDESFLVSVGGVVSDLNGMGQNYRTVLLGEILDGGRMIVVFPLQRFFGDIDGTFQGNGRLRVSDGFCD